MHVVLPAMYGAQHSALYGGERFTFIEGSTKSGKTIGALLWQLERALTSPGEHWWVAPSYQQAKIAYRRAKDYFRDLVVMARETSPPVLNLKGGSRWSFLTGDDPDALYGEGCGSVVLDEASRMREGAFIACRSTLSTTRGPLVAIGNVAGRRNWFYRMCRRAEAGEPGYHYARLTASDAVSGGVLSQDEVDQAARDIPHDLFRELYYCEPAGDAFNPFGQDLVDAAYVQSRPIGPAVVYGVDLARHVDYSVIVGLSSTGGVVTFDRFRLPWADTRARIASTVGSVPTLIDATGVGDPVYEQLYGAGIDVEPFKFSAASKQRLMDRLRIALADQEITHAEKILHFELSSFEYSRTSGGRVTYSAPHGEHDDSVMALALAVYHGSSRGLVGSSLIEPAGAIGYRRSEGRVKFR